MSLSFPNPSRDFQKSRNAVGFTGYDGMFEVQFFVDIDALAKLDTSSIASGTAESRWLNAFDALRTSILDVAREVYANSRRTTYLLTAADFR
ncbi:DUF1488 domain-containing protein [Pelagibacterium flavum]|uniref:DUF1488 domain-containing protein n=1 Tax=Pelagibacterium flavum TaxID=2984530 RepID=A0ABY6IP09_9HYPH|nr:DUF1488 domain-containing protein [Pelagibacterium sp. YIM 151497]MAN78236.1 hypothetical protein [Hyphomicrobiales bacterium]UYQ72346.1 DUF1488 domain-containing protein [Pelagibacterium sp. YIM 151497]|tara:strand:- start:4452 stop:4727 length:276 start_codon:yes stop_codon:yes gene_type:complete